MTIENAHVKDVVNRGFTVRWKRRLKIDKSKKEERDLIIAMNPYLNKSSGIRDIVNELVEDEKMRIPLELGSVLSVPFKNSTGADSLLHVAICHTNEPNGWAKTPEYLDSCFDKIINHDEAEGVQSRKYDIVQIGTGLGKTYGAPVAEINKVIANTNLKMDLCIAPKGSKWPVDWQDGVKLAIKGIVALG